MSSLQLLFLSSQLYLSLSDIIECNDANQCYNETISCAANADCTVQCSGSCAFSTITCPQSPSAKCIVNCADSTSCDNIEIRAQSSRSLDIVISEHSSLAYSNIYCPFESCNITYTGMDYALNNINIYTIHNYDSININCQSISHCWAHNSDPVLHFGDSAYSQTCTIYDPNQCQTNNILIANEIENVISSTVTPTIAAPNNDTIDIVNNNEYDSKAGMSDALVFTFFGMICGIVALLFCCFVLFCCKSAHKSTKLRIQMPRKRSIKPKQLSPSLKKLSPGLRPSNVEMSNVDFMFSLSEKSSNIVVTVEKYENSENRCDEEQIHSMVSGALSPNSGFGGFGSVRSLSETIPNKSQEFIVCGEDEENSQYSTPV